MVGAAGEDAKAIFESLFLKHRQSLRAFVFASIRDRGIAEDVLQEIATALWVARERFDASRPFLPWAFGVSANIIRQHHSQGTRRHLALAPEVVEAMVDAASRLETPLDRDDAEDVLRGCMKKLPARSNRLLVLRYVNDLALPAIASRAGIGVEGVRKALARLRHGLRVCVEKRIRKGAGT